MFRSLYRWRMRQLFRAYLPAAELDSIFDSSRLSQGECLKLLIAGILPSIWQRSPNESEAMRELQQTISRALQSRADASK